jgi:ubiquinone/menaquinone biosynthesis C-methylase UbiE
MTTVLRRRDESLKRAWDDRVDEWHEHVVDTDSFRAIRDALLDAAAPTPADRAVDLGAGTGFVTLPLARRAATVLAVDISPSMLDALATAAASEGLPLQTKAADLATLDLPPSSVDLVVSNYALHHLTDADKAELVRRVHGWLRPGGRIAVADMMFGRGTSARDRAIARQKVAALLRKGPGGLWRIAKNLVRFGMRVGMEQPAPPEAWTSMMQAAGFTAIEHRELPAEASLVIAHRSEAA